MPKISDRVSPFIRTQSCAVRLLGLFVAFSAVADDGAARPHSGHRSLLARRSYPQPTHRSCPRRQRSRIGLRASTQTVSVGNSSTNQNGICTPRIDSRSASLVTSIRSIWKPSQCGPFGSNQYSNRSCSMEMGRQPNELVHSGIFFWRFAGAMPRS